MNGFYGNEIKKVPQRLKRACENRRFRRAISIGRHEYAVMKAGTSGAKALINPAIYGTAEAEAVPFVQSCFVADGRAVSSRFLHAAEWLRTRWVPRLWRSHGKPGLAGHNGDSIPSPSGLGLEFLHI